MTENYGIVGKVTSAPSLRETAAGRPYCAFSVVVQPWLPGDVPQPEAENYKVTTYGALAINVASLVRKGSRVVVSGLYELEKWTGNDGFERTTKKIIGNAIGLDLRFASVVRPSEMSEV